MAKNQKSWNDKFNKIVSKELSLEDAFEWRFALEENKQDSSLQLNLRQFQIATYEGAYEGPTKSGFVLKIKSKEDFEKFKKFMIESLEETEKHI